MAANVSDLYRQLEDAVLQDDFERAKDLVEKEAPVNGVLSSYGTDQTLLMIACDNKNKTIVDLLLKIGAEVNETDCWGGTALMCTAKGGDEEIFDVLIEHSADVMMKNNVRWTVFHVAAMCNSKSILDRLMLVDWGSTVDIEDEDGRTPLWYAASYGHVDCVDVLLVHGADPDHKSEFGRSPLDIAKKEGQTTIVSLMTKALERGRQREQADSKVKPAQLVDVADKVAGDWKKLASWLSPDLFSMLKLKEIEEDHSRAFSRARAVLEMWSNKLVSKATCRLLIHSLCRMDQRAVAAEVFGSELVDFVQPLSC